MSENKDRVEINVVQVVASALAAVSSAVLLSTVGVAGTVIGAAVGSVIATVGSALYSYSLRVSRERMAAAAQVAASTRVLRANRTGAPVTTPEEAPVVQEAGRPRWREALAGLPWKRVALVAGGIFLAAMVAIVGFELIAGRSVSTLTHGSDSSGHRTSLGFGESTAKKPSKTPSPTPSSAPTRSGTTRVPGSTAAHSAKPTRSSAPTRSATPSASVPSPTASSTVVPTATPTG